MCGIDQLHLCKLLVCREVCRRMIDSFEKIFDLMNVVNYEKLPKDFFSKVSLQRHKYCATKSLSLHSSQASVRMLFIHK